MPVSRAYAKKAKKIPNRVKTFGKSSEIILLYCRLMQYVRRVHYLPRDGWQIGSMKTLNVVWAFGVCLAGLVHAQKQGNNNRGHRELYFLDFLDPPECSAYGGCFLWLFGATMYTGSGDECKETCAFFPFIMRSSGYTCGTCEGKKRRKGCSHETSFIRKLEHAVFLF